MATLGGTNVVEITSRISNNKGAALNLGSQPVAVFRITGASVGDTAAISAAQLPYITSVVGPVTHNIGTTASTSVTSVTVTIPHLNATATSGTVGNIDVYLVGPLPTS